MLKSVPQIHGLFYLQKLAIELWKSSVMLNSLKLDTFTRSKLCF